jgi:hypothetical protein
VARPREVHPAHELETFIDEVSDELSTEYERISRRAREDPGTAGDEGEENWRALLAEWLPEQLTVVTKGRILSESGIPSPQVDVLILRPGYPPALRGKKLYLAGGVLAAFECKLTLRAEHVAEAAKNARVVRALVNHRKGSPYNELHCPISFGLLAHRTSLRGDAAARIDSLLRHELAADVHPRDVLDVVCVANLACWRSWNTILTPQSIEPPMDAGSAKSPAELWETARAIHDLDEPGSIRQHYARWEPFSTAGESEAPKPLYELIRHLMRRFAWEFAEYRPLAEYWVQARTRGSGNAAVASRSFPLSILSDPVKRGVESGGLALDEDWHRWSAAD